MTLKIQGRSVADGNIGNITDFTQIEAAEGRIFETIDDTNNLSTWVVESTDKGGNLISGGLYANPVNASPEIKIPKPVVSIPFGINQTEEFLNGSVSCVRSTIKNYTDIYGILREAPANALAIEKDGALIEGQSTNRFTYSNEFGNPNWGGDSSPALSSEKAPDGVSNSYLISSSGGLLGMSQFVDTITSSQRFSYSIYVKNIDASTMMLQVDFSSKTIPVFNFLTGDFDNPESTDASFESLANGWYRFKCFDFSTSSDGNLVIRFVTNSGGRCLVSFAQLEYLPICTSYISTTSSPATRAADVVTIPTLNNYLGQNEGAHTIYIKASSKNQGVTVLNAKSTTGQNDKYRFQIDNDRGEFSNGSTTTTNTPTTTASSLNSYALTFDGVKSLAYVNGVGGGDGLSQADSELDTASPLTIGSTDSGASNNMYGHVKDLKVFNVGLSASQIKGLV